MSTKEEEFKRAVTEFDRATRPVVSEVLDLALKVMAQGAAALRAAGENVDKIADSAVNLAHAQADLIASDQEHSPEPGATAPKRKRATRQTGSGT